MSAAALHERLGVSQIGGGVLVLAATWLVSAHENRAAAQCGE